MAELTPRPAQQAILDYTDGPMGVSAVPGSGKTFTLSLLAARLVEKLAAAGRLDDQEVLIVSFSNTAGGNFRSRIGRFLREERGLLPGVGYRVRTLHGLAHDIVRERPALVGLSENFSIISKETSDEIKDALVNSYIKLNPDVFGPYIQTEYLQNMRRIERYVLSDALDLATNFIRVAKELRVEPSRLAANLAQQSGTWPLLDFGIRVYTDYQRSLFTREAVDFDDLIVLAIQALQSDEHFLHRLQRRWPYVLEDEAQDSSLLQETMLRLLTNDNGNWVRVGDPNQAINTTFSSADIRYLRDFVAKYPDQARPLPNSGRSALPIIAAANYLIDWSRRAHPVLTPDEALAEPHIEPTGPDDAQPNPPPGEPAIHVFDRPLTPDEELDVIMTSLTRWLPDHRDQTVAVLVPEKNRGDQLVKRLEDQDLPYNNQGVQNASNAARSVAADLSIVLAYISQPEAPVMLPSRSIVNLKSVWDKVWWPKRGVPLTLKLAGLTDEQIAAATFDPDQMPEVVATFGRALGKLREPESFVFPDRVDWLDSLEWLREEERLREVAVAFRQDLQTWTEATILPVDELLLTLGNALFDAPSDLALTYHLAMLLVKLGNENPVWRLQEFAVELDNIAQNKRRIPSFEDEEDYEPKPGEIAVSTLHKAKGLEWDRVYLMAVNDYSFPAGSENETYRGERWYVRNSLNLVAEAEEQLRQLHGGTLDEYAPGAATVAVRRATGGERLRLLYVGITRARRELILTYNTGRNPQRNPNQPAAAFLALADFVGGLPQVE